VAATGNGRPWTRWPRTLRNRQEITELNHVRRRIGRIV